MDLNTEQQKAITSEGVVIIIAGPGTGKTKTLTSRIVYLIKEKSVPPEEILALTFTKKASAEMKDRLSFLSKLPYISTFHGLAFDILKNSNTSPEIISERERSDILYGIQEKKTGKDIKKKDMRDLSLFITTYKNKLQADEMPSIVSEYNTILHERGLSDYDDLLLKLYNLLKDNDPQVLKYKSLFSHIHIDEFQDTNTLQYEIIKQLMNSNNLFVIGDPNQSIYSFRGADSKVFNDLKKDFPNYSEISLQNNYRSAKHILETSSQLFKNSNLVPSIQENGEVCVIKTVNEFTEAEWIVEMINQKIGGTDLLKAGEITEDDKRKTVFSDFAVIYRTHGFNRILEQKFIDSGIPYQIIGGDSPYEQPEVAFIVNLLQYLVHKSDTYLKELLYSPVLGVSPKSLYSLSKLFSSGKKPLLEIVDKSKEQYIQDKKDMKILSTFTQVVKELDTEAKSISLLKLIHKILEIKYMKDYLDAKHLKQRNIHTFLSSITQFNDKSDGLERCVEYFSYLKEHEFYDPVSSKVTLLTMHAAKGLEFKYVCICGFEEGIIPFGTDDSNQNTAEETRLLYVAMTRAKEGLYLLQAKERNKKITKPSRFYELIKSFICVEKEDAAIKLHEKKIKKWKEKKSQLQLF